MQALGNQRRRVRQGRARRRSPQRTVDPAALKSFWTSLTLAKKLQILQFEDRDLVERAYVIQQMLWYSELMCIKSGVRVSDGAGKGVHTLTMEAFEFKWHATGAAWLRVCRGGVADGAGGFTPLIPHDAADAAPAAFAARVAFVEGEDFIERLEKRIGAPLLDGLPALRREEWAGVFEPTANSWAEYERQVLKLVRLALVQAHQDAMPTAALEVAAPGATDAADSVDVEVFSEALEFESPSRASGIGAKKRARKRRKAAAAAVAACCLNTETASEEIEAPLPEEEPASKLSPRPRSSDGDEAVEEESGRARTEVPAESECLIAANVDEVALDSVAAATSSSPTEDDGLAAWETVSRKRDRQRARPQPPIIFEERPQFADETRPAQPAPSAQSSATQSAVRNVPAVSSKCAVYASEAVATPLKTPAETAGVQESSAGTSAHVAEEALGDDVGMARYPSKAAASWLSAWRSNGPAHSAAQSWHGRGTVVGTWNTSEAICIMATVKRTFLEVEPVLPHEKTRPRSRSLDPAICVC